MGPSHVKGTRVAENETFVLEVGATITQDFRGVGLLIVTVVRKYRVRCPFQEVQMGIMAGIGSVSRLR